MGKLKIMGLDFEALTFHLSGSIVSNIRHSSDMCQSDLGYEMEGAKMTRKPKKLTVSHTGLSRVGVNEEQDFTFAVGSHEYHCTRFQAKFISNRVFRLLSTDCTANRLETSDISDSDHELLQICSIYSGESIDICDSNVSSLLEFCGWLCNSELESQLIEYSIGDDSLSISNVLSRLDLKSSHSVDISNEINFISSRLNDFSIESLGCLNSSIFERILSNESFRIRNEDSLLDILTSIGYFELLGYVECLFLSVSGIDRFLDILSSPSFSPLSMDSPVWRSLCRRLRCSVDVSQMSHSRFDRSFPFIDDPFSGILSQLTFVCGGNVHERGIIEITCSSSWRNQFWQVANHGWTDHWQSKDEANSWICFNFKDQCLKLQHYTLKSPSNGCYCTDWVIEGSNEGSRWTVIDERHTDDVIGQNVVQTFSCSSSSSSSLGGYCQIRWRMTDKGKDRPGSGRCCHQQKLCNIEFFGIFCPSF
jgi:hypothetical protein